VHDAQRRVEPRVEDLLGERVVGDRERALGSPPRGLGGGGGGGGGGSARGRALGSPRRGRGGGGSGGGEADDDGEQQAESFHGRPPSRPGSSQGGRRRRGDGSTG